jgi:hypothetical protein
MTHDDWLDAEHFHALERHQIAARALVQDGLPNEVVGAVVIAAAIERAALRLAVKGARMTDMLNEMREALYAIAP